MQVTGDIRILAESVARAGEVLTPEALSFLTGLQRRFDGERDQLLRARAELQVRISAGEQLRFLDETRSVREGEWQVAPTPPDLQDRRCEITGPAERKMIINALNSGARVFMADFEDALSPTWENVVQGQVNLIDAVARTIEFSSPEGRAYRLAERTATLVVRPRGWHLLESHVTVGGKPMSASLFDAGLFLFHNARQLLDRGSGPYLYLAKLESHVEARLWNDVFSYAEEELGLPDGCVKATVLIETILAAFEMDEILFELRARAAGLNAGRWDYIFSVIKKFRERPESVLPDRAQVTMTVPFMRAYTDLLVRTCHRRGAHAIGGMAAFVPNRRDRELNARALARVREDKERESNDGFDGTWVAHPDLVPVATEVFDAVLGDRPNQLHRLREEVAVIPEQLLDVTVPGGTVTEDGVRGNVSVALQYLESWLRGSGAVTINDLMEDAATAEIARSQVWQWVHHHVRTADGAVVTRHLVSRLIAEELERVRSAAGEGSSGRGRWAEARDLVDQVALSPDFVEFLTIPGHEMLG
jgi:malate synthase